MKGMQAAVLIIIFVAFIALRVVVDIVPSLDDGFRDYFGGKSDDGTAGNLNGDGVDEASDGDDATGTDDDAGAGANDSDAGGDDGDNDGDDGGDSGDDADITGVYNDAFN